MLERSSAHVARHCLWSQRDLGSAHVSATDGDGGRANTRTTHGDPRTGINGGDFRRGHLYDGGPAGATLVIQWTLEDTDLALPGLCMITVDAGKTLADVDAAPGYPQPFRAHLTYGDCWPMEYGLTATARQVIMKTGPAYLICFGSETKKIGALGPIEVVP